MQMSGQIRYSEEFKIDAVAQVTERGYAVKEVAERLGISTKSLYTWMTRFSTPQRQTDQEAGPASQEGTCARDGGARQDVFEYIEMFCNPKRKHTNNDMLSPVDFEIRQQKLKQAGV